MWSGTAGAWMPRMPADATGLTAGLSAALPRPGVTHDRGAALRDVAVMIAGAGRDICDVVVLREQDPVFGPAAPAAAARRSLNEIDGPALARVMMVGSTLRERVWEWIGARHGRIPPAPAC